MNQNLAHKALRIVADVLMNSKKLSECYASKALARLLREQCILDDLVCRNRKFVHKQKLIYETFTNDSTPRTHHVHDAKREQIL